MSIRATLPHCLNILRRKVSGTRFARSFVITENPIDPDKLTDKRGQVQIGRRSNQTNDLSIFIDHSVRGMPLGKRIEFAQPPHNVVKAAIKSTAKNVDLIFLIVGYSLWLLLVLPYWKKVICRQCALGLSLTVSRSVPKRGSYPPS